MKKIVIIILLMFLNALLQDVKAQMRYSGTTVIIGFSMYDNKGLAAQLVSEANDIITVIFPDENVTDG